MSIDLGLKPGVGTFALLNGACWIGSEKPVVAGARFAEQARGEAIGT